VAETAWFNGPNQPDQRTIIQPDVLADILASVPSSTNFHRNGGAPSCCGLSYLSRLAGQTPLKWGTGAIPSPTLGGRTASRQASDAVWFGADHNTVHLASMGPLASAGWLAQPSGIFPAQQKLQAAIRRFTNGRDSPGSGCSQRQPPMGLAAVGWNSTNWLNTLYAQTLLLLGSASKLSGNCRASISMVTSLRQKKVLAGRV